MSALPDRPAAPPPTIGQLLASARRRLAAVHDSGSLDAEVLLAYVLGVSRSYLRAWPERVLPTAAVARLEALVQRRAADEPVAYLTGRREFWSLDLEVTPQTLVPRPETETLVERALALLPEQRLVRVADLGTGSGAIALALAKERPHWHLLATDLSATALTVARANAERLGIANVEFREGNWCEPLGAEQFDAIVSNPPYVRADDVVLQRGELAYEPALALTPGEEGLEAIRIIVAEARQHLLRGGWLLLEHGFDQQSAVLGLLREADFAEVSGFTDHAGVPRVVAARRR